MVAEILKEGTIGEKRRSNKLGTTNGKGNGKGKGKEFTTKLTDGPLKNILVERSSTVACQFKLLNELKQIYANYEGMMRIASCLNHGKSNLLSCTGDIEVPVKDANGDIIKDIDRKVVTKVINIPRISGE